METTTSEKKEDIISSPVCDRCGKVISSTFDYSNQYPYFFYGGYKLVDRKRPLIYIEYQEIFGEILKERFIHNHDLEELYTMYDFEIVKNALIWNSIRKYGQLSGECRDCFFQEGPYKHYDEEEMDSINIRVSKTYEDIVIREGWKKK